MTNPKFSSFLLTVGLILLPAPTAWCADEPATQRPSEQAAFGHLTLQEALTEALAQNPQLRVIEADVESARGEVLTAQTRPNAELTVAPGIKRVRETETSHHEFKGTVGLSLPVQFPGKRELLVSIAERNVELRKLGTEGLRFQLGAAVKKAFSELLAAQKIIELRRQQLESAQTFQLAAARRAEAGYASDFEAVKSQGDVINTKKLLGAAAGEIAAARIELNFLLGRDLLAPLEVVGALDELAAPRSFPELLATAFSDNPSLRIQAMKAELAGLNLRKARLARKPDFSIGPSLEYSKSEQILGLSASFELPSRHSGRGEIQTATAEQRKIMAETDVLRREIAGAAAKASAQYAAACSQLELYSPAYLDQLKAIVDQAERSYAQNATSLLIYLDAKRTYFDTLADYYDAIAAVASSRAALEAAVGVPFETNSSKSKR